MNDYEMATFVEGNVLGEGWRYRINRLVKADGATTYVALLEREDPLGRAAKLYMWLSEFETIGEAREAAHKALLHVTLYANSKYVVPMPERAMAD